MLMSQMNACDTYLHPPLSNLVFMWSRTFNREKRVNKIINKGLGVFAGALHHNSSCVVFILGAREKYAAQRS